MVIRYPEWFRCELCGGHAGRGPANRRRNSKPDTVLVEEGLDRRLTCPCTLSGRGNAGEGKARPALHVLAAAASGVVESRATLQLENLPLRHQLGVLSLSEAA